MLAIIRKWNPQGSEVDTPHSSKVSYTTVFWSFEGAPNFSSGVHYLMVKLLFPLLQRFTCIVHLFHVSWDLFLAELILFYGEIVVSSVTKICYFISFFSRLMRSISYRTGAISFLNCFFGCYKYCPLYFIYFTSHEVFCL